MSKGVNNFAWLGMQEKKEVKLTNENSIKCNYFNV